jgi:flavin reductase (DIM6/NTAB) family NADH-FMN oxidoreductase RutF
VIELGTHDMFLAEVVAVNVNEDLLDEKGTLHLEKAELIAYAHGQYYGLGQHIGKFGYSVKKKK